MHHLSVVAANVFLVWLATYPVVMLFVAAAPMYEIVPLTIPSVSVPRMIIIRVCLMLCKVIAPVRRRGVVMPICPSMLFLAMLVGTAVLRAWVNVTVEQLLPTMAVVNIVLTMARLHF